MSERVQAFRDEFPPPGRTVPQLLLRQREKFGDHPLFIGPGGRITFAQAPDRVAERAGALSAAGIRKGDVVAILSENHLDFALTFLAAGWIGCLLLPINTALKGPQIQYALARSGARLLLCQSAFAETVRTVDFSTLPKLEAVWTDERYDGTPSRWITDPGIGASVDAGSLSPGDAFALFFTSGTSGPSKGVTCPQAQFFWWGAHTAAILGVMPGEVLHTTLPMFHVNAANTMFQALLTGATMVIETRFSVSAFYERLIETKASATYLLGAMVPMLLSRPISAAERDHGVTRALAPGVPAPLKAAFTERTGIVLVDGFGSTETNFVIASPFGETPSAGMGRIRPGFTARVVDAHDNEVAPRRGWRTDSALGRSFRLHDRLLRRARQDRGGLA